MMPSNEVSLTVDFKNVKLVQEIIKKFTDEATRLEERNGILYSHIELLNKALDVLCPLVARTIDFLPSEQFTLRAATREALDNVTYIQNKEYRENTNPDYYKQEIARLTALVERLKEDAERLAKYCQHIPMPDTTCGMSSSGAWNCNCGATEAFYIHRTLMKELE